LIYDGCPSHLTDNVIEYLTSHNVSIKMLPPYTSHLLHPLDVLMFAPFKNLHANFKDMSDDQVVNFIYSLLYKFQKTFDFHSIVKSFEKVGIVHRSEGKQSERKSYFKVDVTKISKENHKKMDNVLKDLTSEHFNKAISITLPSSKVCE